MMNAWSRSWSARKAAPFSACVNIAYLVAKYSMGQTLGRRRQITGFQNIHVIQLVPGDDVRQGASGDLVFTGCAAPLPFGVGEILAEIGGGLAHGGEFVNQAGQCARIEI